MCFTFVDIFLSDTIVAKGGSLFGVFLYRSRRFVFVNNDKLDPTQVPSKWLMEMLFAR